jgi:hypothetical protein
MARNAISEFVESTHEGQRSAPTGTPKIWDSGEKRSGGNIGKTLFAFRPPLLHPPGPALKSNRARLRHPHLGKVFVFNADRVGEFASFAGCTDHRCVRNGVPFVEVTHI